MSRRLLRRIVETSIRPSFVVMQRQTKWYAVEDVERPAIEVARACIRDRMRWVWRMLGRAALAAPGRTEEIHQLRVATRRAATALELFEPLFAAAEFAWIAKQLKRLRQAAGTARDRDVLRLHYAGLPASERPPGRVLEKLERRCEALRPAIFKLLKKLRAKNFPARVRSALRRRGKQPDASQSFREFAIASFSRAWNEYLAAANEKLERIDALHEFRIRTKAIRYTSETFASALPSAARETLYPRISALQESLGLINDHAMAIDALEEFVASHGRKSKAARWATGELPIRRAALSAAHATFLADWPELRRDLLADAGTLGPTQETAA